MNKQAVWSLPDFQNIDFAEIAAKSAPVMVPFAPMTIATIGLAKGLTEWGGFGYLPATITSVGMELVGMSAAHIMTECAMNKHWGRFWLSAALLGAYSWFAYDAIGHVKNASQFQPYVGLSVVGYILYAMWRFGKKELENAETKRRQDAADRAEANKIALEKMEIERLQTEHKIALLKAQAESDALKSEAEARRVNAERNRQNAENRAAKLSNGHASPSKVSKLDNGQHKPAPRAENVAAVRDWFSSNTGSNRECARALKVSPSTVSACLEWMQSHPQS